MVYLNAQKADASLTQYMHAFEFILVKLNELTGQQMSFTAECKLLVSEIYIYIHIYIM